MKRYMPISLLLIAFLSITFVSTLSAQAHRGFANKLRIHQQMRDDGLNLTDEQKSKMADLRLAFQKEILPLRTELQGKMSEIRLLKTEDQPNINKIDNLIEQAEKIRTKIQKSQARHQIEVRKILTPEQQKLWDSRTLREPGHRRMGEKMMEDKGAF